ncbi:hypothetical protein ACKI2C_46995, partial [Streptomyces brasiliscabiei]
MTSEENYLQWKKWADGYTTVHSSAELQEVLFGLGDLGGNDGPHVFIPGIETTSWLVKAVNYIYAPDGWIKAKYGTSDTSAYYTDDLGLTKDHGTVILNTDPNAALAAKEYPAALKSMTDDSTSNDEFWAKALKSFIQHYQDIASKHKDGQNFVNGYWYFYKGGAKQTGFQNITDQNKTVYYNGQGQMQYGQQNVNGKWYLFDKNTGAMKTGLQYIADQKKTVYYNASGQMQYGQQH